MTRQPESLFIPDAAHLLGLTKNQVRGLVDRGAICGVRDRWTTPRIPMQSLDAFVEKHGGWAAWRAGLRAERKALVAETERMRKRLEADELNRVEASLSALRARAREITVRNGRREVRRVLDQANAGGIPMSPEKAARIAARNNPKVSVETVEARVRRARQRHKPPMSLAELKRKSRRELDAARRAVGLPPKAGSSRGR